jgi:hypothetical protein
MISSLAKKFRRNWKCLWCCICLGMKHKKTIFFKSFWSNT